VRLQNKSVVVTGSSRGIGSAIASVFAAEGASVIVNCHQDVPEGTQTVQRILDQGGKAKLCVADVRNPEQVDELIQSAIESFGKIDVLVNNAGIVRDAVLEKMTIEQWHDVLETNLTGAYLCSKAASVPMKAQGHGRIINISSVVAEMGNIGQANYAASKGGVLGLTKALSLELARSGILVNAIAPGFCKTRMVEAIPENVKEKILAKIPLKRFGEPREIAYAAVFLASDECAYITGQTLSVNGGLRL
jgi:3-oxoacyl-[acyl-carrier protein] reductase